MNVYSRNTKSDGEAKDTDFGLTGYRLPPRYDGSRFRRFPPLPPKPPERPPEKPPEKPQARPPEKSHGEGPRPDKDGAYRLIRGIFGDRLGSEELMILSLILILSAAGGDGCDSPGEIILLLALLLLVSS